ncbi:MAG: hypothetical protein NTY01_16370 [Verrucomicrobia bacterium]|nr:hypothetical protein [Verrucomicrobiota bacterium]
MAKTNKKARSRTHTVDALPVLMMIVDKNVAIKDLNAAAREFLGPRYKEVFHMRSGKAFHCVHNQEARAGCGHGRFCQICPIREAATLAYKKQRVVRRRTKAEIGNADQKREVNLLVTATPLPSRGSARILLILEDITALVELQTPVPICASCKRIRDDRPYWEQLEVHLNQHLDLDLSGGVCPKCKQRLYGGLKKSQHLFLKERADLPKHP